MDCYYSQKGTDFPSRHLQIFGLVDYRETKSSAYSIPHRFAHFGLLNVPIRIIRYGTRNSPKGSSSQVTFDPSIAWTYYRTAVNFYGSEDAYYTSEFLGSIQGVKRDLCPGADLIVVRGSPILNIDFNTFDGTTKSSLPMYIKKIIGEHEGNCNRKNFLISSDPEYKRRFDRLKRIRRLFIEAAVEERYEKCAEFRDRIITLEERLAIAENPRQRSLLEDRKVT